MKERGIIFSAPMIKALLAGTKTQTRRLNKLREFGPSTTRGYDWTFRDKRELWNDVMHEQLLARCPYGKVGDRLWCKEGHALRSDVDPMTDLGKARHYLIYRSDHDGELSSEWHHYGGWRSPLFMPRWASRITLEITEVRVQRVQEISEDDARAEGVPPFFERYECVGQDQSICDGELARDFPYRACFACVWDEINGDRALWSSRPWVWAISFKRVEQP